jgi:2-amino-4-hydroxy-6-hydroxymethyldihydropteridine diphosphokinase
MNHAYLLIGGNVGDRMGRLQFALRLIEAELGNVRVVSSIYETAAWGKTVQPDFLNQALLVETELSALALMSAILDLELRMGRVRNDKYGPRTIDIDILFYDHDIINIQGLQIPHPQIQNRKFVLCPLFEIAPHFIHPILNKDIEALLEECTDLLDVKKISADFV